MKRLNILHNKPRDITRADAVDWDSAVTLWLECFMAAGLSPAETKNLIHGYSKLL